MHSWSGGRCLDLGIGQILGGWPWFHPTIQLDQLMLLLLLLPVKWLRFEKKTGYCPEILVPDREMWLGWPMKAKGWWNRPRGRMLTCFRRISSMLEPTWTRGCDEELALQCLAGQVIQIVHGRQAEGWLLEIYRIYSWASSEIVPVSMESPP